MAAQPLSEHDAARWRRIEEICDAALQLDEAERDAYLTASCGSDEDLRREVDALLVHEQTAKRFLSAPLGAVAASVVDPPRDLIGQSLAGYDIVAKLGEGGMGEVYRARDRTLGREVAIKVLPAAVANDRERLKRFEREARLLASVNHPAIGAIYGVVETGDLRALVLEIIEGETLSDTLARGPLKLPRALTLAAQIADALDHAHRRGITHRDLKPSNMMLCGSGVKLLDFGIGKSTASALEATMTGASTLTHEGAIIGTLHYMSPEQIEGRHTDARSDIFSLGAVLYEMLSGRRAFEGKSQASIMAAVLEAPTPKLMGAGGAIDPRLDRVVTKCLAKHPDDRWQTARDLGDELRWLGTEGANAKDTSRLALASTSRRMTSIAAVLAVLVAVSLVGWASTWRTADSSRSAAPIRFSVQPQQLTLSDGEFDISSDGSQLVYSAVRPGFIGSSLLLRRLDGFDTLTLSGSERFNGPVFSPDGEWVAFYAFNALRKMRIAANAAPVVVAENLRATVGIAWPTADTMLVAGRDQPIRSVPANGGLPTPITTLQPETEVDHHTPELLPSGHALLFAVHGKRNHFSIAVQELRSGARRTLIESGFAPVYSPTGHLLFGRGSAIMAVPFDERSLELRGDPITLVENVSNDARSGVRDYRLSGNGTLVYQPRRPTEGRVLRWVDRNGLESTVGTPARSFDSARVSPDGTRLAFAVQDSDRRDIWTYELAGGQLSRLTQDGDNWGPIWTPDGTGVLHGRDAGASAQVVLNRLNGQSPETLASSVDDQLWPTSTIGDVRQVIVTVQPPTDETFLARATRGSAGLETLLKNEGFPQEAQLSPDGRWLAYRETVNNRTEIVIQSYPEPRMRRQVSVDGGRQPRWRRDGKELFFRFGGRLFAVPIDASGGLKLGAPKLLFDRAQQIAFTDYDVSPDGRFLLILRAPTEDAARQLNVVINWHHELLSRVPVPR